MRIRNFLCHGMLCVTLPFCLGCPNGNPMNMTAGDQAPPESEAVEGSAAEEATEAEESELPAAADAASP
jgi:hypothetical protein